MKLIVGLGNPGSKYAKTRHNVGFMVVELLKHYKELSNKAILMTPTTFMNDSGESVSSKITFHRLSPRDLLLIHDDVDLSLGAVKLQLDRSSAGHKGVQSVINSLGTKVFFRIRVGIGRPEENVTVEDYVLQDFRDSEKPLLNCAIKEAAGLAVNWAEN